MDGSSVGSPSTSATHVARADCPHLADPEWEALQRLATVIGEAGVATMLRTLSPTEQHGVALGFIMREQREVAAAKPVSPGETPRKEHLKLRVSNYMGREGETLLRWLVELDTAVMARRLVDPLAKVAFAMSCLGGRAKSWAYRRRLTDPSCFSTYESFKEELKLAFEPPQNEFRSSAEFLDLQLGKHDVHTYAQRARYLVSNVVTDPMDEATKVVTFMKGLRDGPVKTYLFREYPSTLEAAITLAMQEEFSLKQAKLHTNVPRPPRPAATTEGPELMDLSKASAVGQQKSMGSNVRCFRVSSRSNKKRKGPVGAGRPTGSAVTHVYNGHVLEVRLATGAIVKTEKRVIRARFSYKHRVFVEELLVLDLDDKFDVVLGMPWLARHDPTIDWEKRTVVRFGRRGATESDGPVSAADTPNGASEPPSEAVARAAVSGRSARSARAVTTPGVVDSKRVSDQGPDTSRMFSAIRRRDDNSVSTL
ncbi:putative membrane protein [Phytophthora megakarya]|uniref:Putative membrane protein n=1 Tax=Phytophthora megakarya TaxID=4795 RepID=A0A225VQT6_9STRA|nr:putative membrane protein [Phytophthora megakarya]